MHQSHNKLYNMMLDVMGVSMITILCSGSRGDIQPYIALAQQLKKLNLPVRIVAGKSFESYIRSYSIDFYALSMDYQSTDIDPKLIEAAQSSDNPLKMLMTFNKMKDYVLGLTEEMYNVCKESELIIYHPGCAIGYFAGEILGIPSVLAAPFPMHKTKEIASIIAYGKTRMPITFSYTLLQNLLWMAAKTGIHSFLKKEFGQLPLDFGIPFERVDSTHPAIVSCSSSVFPRPNDWNPNIHQYGYWFVEEDNYTPFTELADFLSKSDKPIYFGFGSVFNERYKEKMLSVILEALRQTNKRAILSGMGNIDIKNDSILCINNVPHTWLFNQVSIVCHHGGSGTTAAGFKAGIPSIIIPFSNDQFAWAHRAYDLGVGSYPIYRKKLSVQKLVDAIHYTSTENIVENSKRLAKMISLENGAEACAQTILSLLNQVD
jgi:sterol 3beta-glucosyltransferase